MSESITTDEKTIGIGKIQFFDSIQPPLPAAPYTLKATQTIENLTGQTTAPEYMATKKIVVDGPRFSLNPSQINSMFPPANQQGDFSNDLPHMIFNNFALPWSREINPKGKTINQIPWMGLLTLYPEDLLSSDNPSPNVLEPVTIPVSQLVTPTVNDKDVLLPDLGEILVPEDTKVSVIDVNIDFFQAIAPKLSELPYLAHARKVNTGGKVMLGMDADGSFSLVVGNRLPKAAEIGLTKNSVYLVSYEGHQDHLSGATIATKYKRIRLVLLGSWQFSAAPAKGSFIKLMEDLCDDGRGGVKLLQMPKVTSEQDSQDKNDLVEEALDIGYVPLQNQMRIGENATSWYRGPLTPSPTKRDHEYGPYFFSDHAIHYDKESGIFNHAYAAAWQMGRLLALSDANFSRKMFEWRNAYVAEVRKIVLSSVPSKIAKSLIGPEAGDVPVNMLSGVQSLMAKHFNKVSWPKVKTRRQNALPENLPGVLSDDEIDEISRKGTDPVMEIMRKLKGK